MHLIPIIISPFEVLSARHEAVVAELRPRRVHSHGVLHRQEKLGAPIVDMVAVAAAAAAAAGAAVSRMRKAATPLMWSMLYVGEKADPSIVKASSTTMDENIRDSLLALSWTYIHVLGECFVLSGGIARARKRCLLPRSDPSLFTCSMVGAG